MKRTKGRRIEPRIVDPENHPRRSVSLRVAAEFLELDERTTRARIEDGVIEAERDGRVYLIAVSELVRYRQQRRDNSIVPHGTASTTKRA